jgi:predicted nucleic acid-binding protein
MSDKFFIDTNVIAYGFEGEGMKSRVSRLVMGLALESADAAISFQVIQEFCNIALRKFAHRFAPAELHDYLRLALFPLCKVFPSFEMLDHALRIQQMHRIGYYDSLIVSAATQGNCKYLLTEDLNDGQTIEGVTVLNPFGDESKLFAALPKLKRF